jgi:hypothetical protein
MYPKSAIALVAVLATFACAVPTVSRADDQSEWLQRQLQITDGYAPPPMLTAPDGDRAGAAAVRRTALRASHPRKPAPRPRRVLQRAASAHEPPVCQATCAGVERPPAQVPCADCREIESPRRVDMDSEGFGIAAIGMLLLVAGFKVMKMAGALQQA